MIAVDPLRSPKPTQRSGPGEANRHDLLGRVGIDDGSALSPEPVGIRGEGRVLSPVVDHEPAVPIPRRSHWCRCRAGRTGGRARGSFGFPRLGRRRSARLRTSRPQIWADLLPLGSGWSELYRFSPGARANHFRKRLLTLPEKEADSFPILRNDVKIVLNKNGRQNAIIQPLPGYLTKESMSSNYCA